MPVGGHFASPAPPLLEETPVEAPPVVEETLIPPEDPKMGSVEESSQEEPLPEAVTPVNPLAGLGPTSTRAALLQKAAELGLQVPDGAKRPEIWKILTAAQA